MDRAIPKLDLDRTFDYEEELVLRLVQMPGKFSLKLCDLDMLAIELADNLR
jgi:hypothetical protein